jgi:hypothetical protein
MQMRLLDSSAKGANGAGYGAILAFDFDGYALGAFCDDSRVVDPRELFSGAPKKSVHSADTPIDSS